MKRTSIFLDDQDRESLGVIREAHGLATDSSAVRFAIRQVARDLKRQARRRERGAPGQPATGRSTTKEEDMS